MPIAEIHGKSPYTRSEDSLTADVFGAFRYLPAETGLVAFLRAVPGLGELLPPAFASAQLDIHFWPLGITREPDLLLALRIDGIAYHIVVEAKYLSGPSDIELSVEDVEGQEIVVGNQLADQMRELMDGHYTVRHEGSRDQPLLLDSEPDRRALLYLTAHPVRPDGELAPSAELLPHLVQRLSWASWYDVHDFLSTRRQAFGAFPFDRIVADLLLLLRKKQFGGFQGWTKPPTIAFRAIAGAFWIGHHADAPTFDGIRLPPSRLPLCQMGSFWVDQRDK